VSDPLQFSFAFGKTAAARPRDPERPMRMLVIGDFGGQDAAAAGGSLAQRRILRIDVDNFETILAKKRPVAKVPLGDRGDVQVEIEIKELDDFHPDHLYRQLPIFQELRELRKRLSDPQTFAQAAEKLRDALPHVAKQDEPKSNAQPEPTSPSESNADTLERILGKTMSDMDTKSGSAAGVDISRLIEQIVAPHVVPGPDPRQDEYLQSLDAAVSAQLRSILHHDAFQSLEASWRGLHFLVSNVAMSEQLKVYMWDVTRAELSQAIESDTGLLEDSLLFRQLVTEHEEEPWSVLVADLLFGKQSQDLQLLASLGAVAGQSGGPLLASAAPSLLSFEAWTDELRFTNAEEGTDEASNNWEALRSSAVAPWIGLAAPRFLLRLPYGATTDPLESLPFEEIQAAGAQHAEFLWGNPSTFCATLIATSFLENGWDMSLADNLELDDFPAVLFDVDGEKQLKACAEAYLSERVAEALLNRGLMPLLSFKNRNAVRLMRFQSIANPLQPLSGPWG
jgi:type VI secretion system protein ImpC